jgi:hypothetical protein
MAPSSRALDSLNELGAPAGGFRRPSPAKAENPGAQREYRAAKPPRSAPGTLDAREHRGLIPTRWADTIKITPMRFCRFSGRVNFHRSPLCGAPQPHFGCTASRGGLERHSAEVIRVSLHSSP